MAHLLIAYKQFPAPSVGHAGGESLFRLMEALHRRGHRLTLVARISDEEREQLSALNAICQKVVTVPHHSSFPGPRPLALVRSYMAFRAALRGALRDDVPDWVHVETTQTAVATLGLPLPSSSYRTQDLNWFLIEQKMARMRGVRRRIARMEAGLMRRFESFVCHQYDLMLAISESDRRLLAETCDDARLLVVPLTPALRPDDKVAPAVEGGPNLLFVGAMSRDHNIAGVNWFLDEIWPRIASEVPGARFYVVGGHPSEQLRAQADGERVIVTGFVGDLVAWYQAATIFVSPLLVAGGLLQKIMDAMRMGVPVVATGVCNHGVGATPGRDLVIADTAEGFAAAVLALLRDREARERIGGAGQAFVTEYYDLEAAVDRWEAAMLEIIGET
ncbi:MAG: glycosyltransferase family 4 protein [Anaerolineae bacterium]